MKIYSQINIVLIVFYLFMFTACKQESNTDNNIDNDLKSTVTLFQYTSIGCVVCPENGHEIISKYKNEFGNNLQVISIHGLEAMAKIDGFSLYTKEGKEMYYSADIKALPSGSINSLHKDEIYSPTNLELFLREELNKAPELTLDVTFTIQDSIAKLSIEGHTLSNISKSYGQLNVCAYLVQNRIVGPQKDIRGDHEEYTHQYVLRKPFTPVFGDVLISSVKPDEDFEKIEYNLNLDDANLILSDNGNYNELELKPIVFVYETNGTKHTVPCAINYNIN